MQQAGMHDDPECWYRVTLKAILEDETNLIRWCKRHSSNGKWERQIKAGQVVFFFEQLEDAMMFRLAFRGAI